jgi:hypothetical protein
MQKSRRSVGGFFASEPGMFSRANYGFAKILEGRKMSKPLHRIATAMAALIVFGVLGAPVALAGSVEVISQDVSVEGQSQEEWSRAWWQWAASFAQEDSPVADTTGQLCASGQSGKVWFLAGTYEAKRTIRTCEVPRGTHLFFPLINYAVSPDSRNRLDCAAAIASAAASTDSPRGLVLEIDGQRIDHLEAHRQVTRTCFDMGVRATPKVRLYPTAANGYYVMVRPLSPGKHTIHLGGMLAEFAQAVTYHLMVK